MNYEPALQPFNSHVQESTVFAHDCVAAWRMRNGAVAIAHGSIAEQRRGQRQTFSRRAGTRPSLPHSVLMERFFLSVICASAALLVAAFVATNPMAKADSQSAQAPVLRLVQR
jgi:hypothetical protein